MLKSPPGMGFYNTPFPTAWLGARDLAHGPRPEQNHPMLIEQLQRYRQDEGACSVVR